MKKFIIDYSGEAEIEAEDFRDAVRKFEAANPNAKADMVTDSETNVDGHRITEFVDDHCEGCSIAILEGDEHIFTEDGVTLCKKCSDGIKDE